MKRDGNKKTELMGEEDVTSGRGRDDLLTPFSFLSPAFLS